MTDEEERIYDLSLNPYELELLRMRVEGSGSAPGSLEPEPLDSEGLTRSEREACTATGCEPSVFLRLKALR
jgi:hypothetical protein